MSEWTKEELEEFWRWPTAFGSLLGGKDGNIEARKDWMDKMRAAEKKQLEALPFRIDKEGNWEGLKAWLPSVDSVPGALFNVDRSVAPLTVGCDYAAKPSEEDRRVSTGWIRVTPTVEEQRDWASQLADECGALKTENTALLAENARLRRRIEDLERKGKKR